MPARCYNLAVSGPRKEFYPQYYLAKRQRERAVLAVTLVFAGIIAVGLIVLAVVYFTKPRENLEQLAENRPEMVAPEPQQAAAAKPPVAPPQAGGQKLLALEDVKEYATSVADLSLMPADIALGAEPAKAEETPPPQVTEEQAQPGETPPAAQEEVEKPQAEPEKPKEEAKKEPEKPKEEPKPEKPKDKPKEQAPAKSGYIYVVIAGVFSSESEANRQRDRLRELGFESSLSVRGAGESKSYAIEIGAPLDEYKPAEAVKNKIRDAGFANAVVLRRDA